MPPARGPRRTRSPDQHRRRGVFAYDESARSANALLSRVGEVTTPPGRLVVFAAPCLVLELLDFLGRFSFAERVVERLTRLLREGPQIRGLWAGHTLVAGHPFVRIL